MDHAIRTNKAPGVNFGGDGAESATSDDGDVTYTLGALKLRGKVSQLNKQQLLIEMIEDELTLKEPRNLMKWLFRFWLVVGIYQGYKIYHSLWFKRLWED